MSTTPGMPRSIASGIVDVVATDAACGKLIPTVSLWSIGQTAAGSLRNIVNMSAEGLAWAGAAVMPESGGYAKEYWERVGADQACTAIAAVSSKAINEAVRGGRLPSWVTGSTTVDRSPGAGKDVFAHHTATGVEVGHGKVYVFDWHATLTRRNPLISRSLEEWQAGNDRYRVLFSVFQGWQ